MIEVLPLSASRNLNQGHGHVFKRPDGLRMRCGGPRLCKDCARDLAELQSTKPLPADEVSARISEAVAAERERCAQLAEWHYPATQDEFGDALRAQADSIAAMIRNPRGNDK